MNRPAKTINERASIRATPNNKRRFRQPPGYYAQEVTDERHWSPTQHFVRAAITARDATNLSSNPA